MRMGRDFGAVAALVVQTLQVLASKGQAASSYFRLTVVTFQ